MTRNERDKLLERLCAMREAYRHRPVADRYGTMAIVDVIAYAQRAMAAIIATERRERPA